MNEIQNARKIGREVVKSVISSETWETNWRFVENLKTIIAKHPMSSLSLIHI